MIAQEQMHRLANVAGLDAHNRQHTVALTDAVRRVAEMADPRAQITVSDMAERLIRYAREQIGGIEYATKPERLDILVTRFLRDEAIQRNAHKFEAGERFIDELVHMVGDVRTTIRNERAAGRDVGFRHIRREGEPMFSIKQLRALASVGSTDGILELSETGKLRDALLSSLTRAILKPPATKALPAGQQRVMSMVAASAERMEA